jgi:Phage tail tube protein
MYQTQSNALVAYKLQTALGTPATGAGGSVLRVSGGTGGQLTKAATESAEVRYDGMRARGRQGIQKTAATWNAEVSMGSWEPIVEAVVRDSWSTPDLILTETTGGLASVVVGANSITAGGGSWITEGLRVGDVVRLTNTTPAQNNNRNVRITALTPSIMTVGETLTANPTADTSFTVTRPGRKLIQSGTLMKRYFTVDEYEMDIDQSQLMNDFVWGTARFSMAPNGIIMFDPGGIGTGHYTAEDASASPVLTTPVATTGLPMAVSDATIRIGDQDICDLTSLDITLDITPSSPDVFGCGNTKYGPDVFTGQMGITINFTALRKDLQFLQDFAAETQYSIYVLAQETEADPRDFFSVFIGNLALGGVTKSAYAAAGGPRTQTVSVPMALVGKDDTGPERDPTMIKFQSSWIAA